MVTALLIAILMLLFSAFFSGMEIAFLSANRLKIELKTRQGNIAARFLSYIIQHPLRTDWVIITILVGNNLALVVFTDRLEFLTTPSMAAYLPLGAITIFQTILGTLIVLFSAEYLPKAVFRSNANTLVYPSSYILAIFTFLLSPFVLAINTISRLFIRYVMGGKEEEKGSAITLTDLNHYLQEVLEIGEGDAVKELDTEMLTNALEFRTIKVREFMLPRTEIIALPIDSSLDELMDLFLETKHSKIIIYRENMDEVAGYVHSQAMFQQPENLAEIVQPVVIVPETMPADMLFSEFSTQRKSIAIVVDEFGGTSGLVTMEDLIEEVFGDIEDEYDKEKEESPERDAVREVLDDGSLLLGARNDIDDLNEEFELQLPEDEAYTTLGGLIMYQAENILDEGQSIKIGEYNIVVVEAEETRVITVKLEMHRRL